MRYLIILAAILFWSNCSITNDRTSAERYMDEIQKEKFEGTFIPDLEPSDISFLLMFRNDKNVVQKYPVNPISSYRGEGITVGIIALWTIESIRLGELNGEDKYKRFPSLNPIVFYTGATFPPANNSQDSIATIYYDWWNTSTSETEKINIDPLEETKYIWN